MKTDTKFTQVKRVLVGLSGVAMLLCSIYLSKEGVGFGQELWWMGLVVAIALSCAEFMFNDSFDEMTWTAMLMGLGAYIYSINTNINGFYYYRHITGDLWTHFDWTNFMGGIFMDVYPELAIAWAFRSSKIGDLLGNIVKAWKSPETMTTPSKYEMKLDPSIASRIGKKRTVEPPYTEREIIPDELVQFRMGSSFSQIGVLEDLDMHRDH